MGSRTLRRIPFLLLAATLAVAAPATAQQPSPDQMARMPLPVDPAVTVGELENGIRYYIRQNARPEQRAELRLVVNAGSVLEEDDQQGLAHLLEHMAFNGTENFERQELVDYLESIGMEFGPSVNAYTSFDETVYMLRVPTDDAEIVETGFQILEDWAHAVTLDPEEVDKERGVVIEEWRLGRGAGARMRDQQFPILFSDSRYADRLPIGKREILESFSQDRIEAFYESWYRPDLMAVVAVGDFDPAEIEERIRTHFSRMEPADDPEPRVVYDVPGHDETRFAIATDPEATSSQVALTWKQPVREEGTVGDYRQSLVERLYNQMLSDRIFELTQQADPPLVFGASGQGRFVRGSEIYQLFAVVRDGGIERGLDAILTEAARVDRHGFTETELERKKIEILRNLEQRFTEREKQESRGFASQYINAYLRGDPIPGIEFEYQAAQALLPTIRLEEVNRLASEWITEENRVVLVNAPEKEGVPVPSEERLAAVMEAVHTKEIEPYVDAVTDAPLVAEAPVPAEVTEEGGIPELEVTEWKLANGVRVLLKPTDFKDDEIVMRAYSWGGSSLAPDETVVPAQMAAVATSRGGVGEFSLVDLQKQLAGKVASASPGMGELTETMSGSASPKDVETLFQLTWLRFTSPRKDEDAFQAYTSQMESFFANRSASPRAAFFDTVSATMSQYHPRRPLPGPEMLEKVDLDASFDFYRERFADASDWTFVFVGAFELEEMRPLVETWLGGLPTTGAGETWRDEGVRPPEGVVEKVVRKGIEPQSQTRIVFHGPFEFTSDNRLRIRLLAEALQIRLREIMREDLGGTYGVGINAGYDQHPEESYTLTVTFGSDPARAEELRGVVFDEVEKVKVEGPTAEELQKVKEQERRGRETNLRENGYWASQLMFADQSGSDPRFLTDFGLIDSVTAEELMEGARRWLDTGRYVQVVLLPEEEGS